MSDSGRRRFGSIFRFFAEIQRRRVTRVFCIYSVAGYALIEVANNVFPPLNLPGWTTTLVVALVLLGLPLALVLGWLFDVTPDGVRLTGPTLTTGAPGAPAAQSPGRASALIGLGMLIALITVGAVATYRIAPHHAGDASVAVLPFANLSNAPDDEYFSDGITEDVVARVAEVRNLRVISRTSVMQYKRTRRPLPEIARELGVGYVLEGSVQREGDVVRVTARLVDAARNEPVWSETYDRAFTRILAVQSEIAEAIAGRLDAGLSRDERRRLADAAGRDVDAAAYDAYLRGVYASDAGRHREAIHWLELSLARDPAFARAQAALARAWFFLGFYGFAPPDSAFGRMHQAALAAVAADPDLADGHAALALYHAHHAWSWGEAEDEFRTALELGPNDAQVHHDYAHFLLALGRADESARESDIAVRLDPANSMLTACAGWHGFTNGDYADAIGRSRKALMMMPDMFWPELILGWAYEQTGESAGAIAAFRAAARHSGDSSIALASLAHALAGAGERTEALAILVELERRARTGYVSAYDLAVVDAALGRTDDAIAQLARARTERAGFLVHAGWDPRLAPLHGDARFASFLAGLGLPLQPLVAARPGAAGTKSGMT